MREVNAVIFDMDGVLVDSEGFWQEAEYEVFSALGVQLSDELCLQTRAMTTSEVAQFWYKRNPWEDIPLEEVEQKVISSVINRIQQQPCAIEGVLSFVEHLKQNGFKVGLATNSPYGIIPPVLEKVGVKDLFDAISSADEVQEGKPDPAIYLLTAEKLGVSPEKCIAIEDSASGARAAHLAGMKVVGYNHLGQYPSIEKADYHLQSFYSALSLFPHLPQSHS